MQRRKDNDRNRRKMKEEVVKGKNRGTGRLEYMQRQENRKAGRRTERSNDTAAKRYCREGNTDRQNHKPKPDKLNA